MSPSPLGRPTTAGGSAFSAVHGLSRCPGLVAHVRGNSADCAAVWTILNAYAPRGATSGQRLRSNPLRAACVAAATSSQTLRINNVDAASHGSLVRRPQLLLAAQDDVRALRTRLKSGSTDDSSSLQCNEAIQALCSAGERWSDVRQAYSDFRSAGIRMDLNTYRMLTAAAIEAKQGMDVVELLEHEQLLHGPPPLPVYCSLISRLLKRPGRGTPERQAALAIWHMLRESNHRLDAPAYRTGMNLFVELGQVAEARRLMEAMRAAGHRPGWGAYHILIKYYAQRGDMDGARRMFAQLRAYCGDRRLEISAYNILLDGFVRLGDLTMARAVLDKARREGVAPDAFTYSAFASGLAAARRLQEAEELLGEMAAEGLPPSPVVYGAILDGCARFGDWTRADRLLARMRADGLRPNLAHYNMLVRGRTYSTGLGTPVPGTGASSNGKWAPAAATSGTTAATTSGGSSTVSCSSSTNGTGSGSATQVETLMAEMRAGGLRPDAVTYGTLVDAAVRSGSIDAALEVLSAMRLEGIQPDGAIFTSLMKLFRTHGCHEQALEVFRQMSSSRSAHVDLWALSCLVAVHASAGQMDDAEAAARRANVMAAEHGRPPPAEAAYALLQGYGRLRQLRPALLSFRRFLAAGGRPHRKMCEFTYRLCLAHFDFEAAAQVLRAMRLIRGLELREALYRQQWEAAQRKLQMRRQTGSSSVGTVFGSSSSAGGGGGDRSDGSESSNPAMEKWKWWFGLPNNYYGTDWK